jgi:ABC-type transport system involved in multi-copper enzyme maturation permease subunit
MNDFPPGAETMAKAAPVDINPTLGGAVRGLWLLTWKSRLSWRQAPVLSVTVLALPLLAFLIMNQGPHFLLIHGEHRGLDNFYCWWVTFYLLVALPLYCLAVFGDLIRDDLQSNTLSFLVTRPLTRARLFLVKFLSQLVWVEVLAFATGLLLVLVGGVSGVDGTLKLGGLLLGIQGIAVLVFGALSALLGLIHRRYMVLGAVYGLVVEVGIGQIPTNINTLSITRHLRTLLANNAHLAQQFDWSAQGTLSSLLIVGLATAIFLVLAAVLFSWVEYHHSEEMQK